MNCNNDTRTTEIYPSRHALARYREHHPDATIKDLTEAFHRAVWISSSQVTLWTGRRPPLHKDYMMKLAKQGKAPRVHISKKGTKRRIHPKWVDTNSTKHDAPQESYYLTDTGKGIFVKSEDGNNTIITYLRLALAFQKDAKRYFDSS